MQDSRVKNITLSADEALIAEARARAAAEHTTLNAAFRQWLGSYTRRAGAQDAFDQIYARLEKVNPGTTFSREEANER